MATADGPAISRAQAKAALWNSAGARVHAVIDGATVPGLPARLAAADSAGWDCLKRGALSAEVAERAAYIVELSAEGVFTDWLLGEGTETFPGWGILMVSSQGLLAMREHCRGLMDVLTVSGERRSWRWYDPEVMQTLLPKLLPSQLDELFEANQSMVLVNSKAWTWYALEQGLLASQVRRLMIGAG